MKICRVSRQESSGRKRREPIVCAPGKSAPLLAQMREAKRRQAAALQRRSTGWKPAVREKLRFGLRGAGRGGFFIRVHQAGSRFRFSIFA
jgi:hypothetical protein